MDDESKQYTAFTSSSMGLYKCESMPFGLCNAPTTFQRLMLSCLGVLNLTYCLIYLDDVIIFSQTEEKHLDFLSCLDDHLPLGDPISRGQSCPGQCHYTFN